jgi:hypothetical protein
MTFSLNNYWLVSSLVITLIAFLGQYFSVRYISLIIFFSFGVFAGFRGEAYNSDTANYILHFKSYENLGISDWKSAILGSWYEPGYSFVAFTSSFILGFDAFLFLITIIPTFIFTWQFFKYKYHPVVIAHIYSTIMLIAVTTTVRHFWALALFFIAINSFAYEKKILLRYSILPVIFHFSTIPVVVSLAMSGRKLTSIIRQLTLLFFFIAIILFTLIYTEFLQILLEKLNDRAFEESGSKGLRNFIMLFILFLTLHYKGTIRISQINLFQYVGIVVVVAIVFFGWLGLNRLTSFFLIGFLAFYNLQNSDNTFNSRLNNAALNLITFFSIFYFIENI